MLFLQLSLFALAGWVLQDRLFRLRPDGPAPHPSERLTAAGLLALALVLALDWLLAATGTLTYGFLAATLLGPGLVVAAAWILDPVGRPSIRSLAGRQVGTLGTPALLGLGSLALFLALILARGLSTPVCGWDSMTYHFPKAAELLRNHGYRLTQACDFRVNVLPWNFELLMAHIMIVTGDDRWTTLLGVLFYSGSLVAALAVVRRWFPPLDGMGALVFILFLAGAPLLLLQAGAFKNDQMLLFLATAVILWAPGWILHGDRVGAVLTATALGLAVGTKTNGIFAVAMYLFLLASVRGWRRVRGQSGAMRGVAGHLALLAVLSLALGGGVYLVHLYRLGSLLGMGDSRSSAALFQGNHVPKLDGFSNLWRFPALLFLRPFNFAPDRMWVPWLRQAWYWPAYSHAYSHFGILNSLAVLALPFGIPAALKRRRDWPVGEMLLATVFALGMTVPIVLQRFRVEGLVIGFPRYLLFQPLFLAAWSFLPLLAMRKSGSARIVPLALAGSLLVSFWAYAGLTLANDSNRSFGYLQEVWDRGENNMVMPIGTCIVDRLAGPGDAVAIDSGFGCWLYPAYGRHWTRPVSFIRWVGGKAVIPPEAKWVVIDRSLNVGWGHPAFNSLGDYWKYFGRGPLRPEDTALIRQLAGQPEFKTVFLDEEHMQAVLVRVAALTPGPGRP